jgi:hypothetical protein
MWGFAAENEEGEHSVECLSDFSQEVGRDVALRLTTEKESEKEEEHSEEWLSVFSHEVENNAIEGVAEIENEDTDNICLAELWEQIEALEDRVKVQGMHIQQVRLEIDEGMGDHDDQSHGQKFLQLWRLQQKNQPLEKLDEAIKEIMELMLKSAQTTSEEKMSRGKTAVAAQRKQQQQNGANGQLHTFVWDPGGLPTITGEAHEQELMIFAAVEYDAGASLHAASQPHQHTRIQRLKREAQPHFEFEFNVNKCLGWWAIGSRAYSGGV